MADTLLLGVDGSECCARSAAFAAAHAQASGARVVVAYVIEWSPYTFNTPEENEQRHRRREEEIERARTTVIDPVVAALERDGIEVEGQVRHGKPAEVLSAMARELEVSGIFIGRRGVSKLQAMLFGSVAGALVQISPVPVTVVP